MAIIEIGPNGAKAHLNYPIVVHQAHEKAPTRILVPTMGDYRELFLFLHELGSGNVGLEHNLVPDEFEAFHFIQSVYKGLIRVAMPLILYEPKSKLLTDVDTGNYITQAFNLAQK